MVDSDAKSKLADWRLKLLQTELMNLTLKLNKLETLEFDYFNEKADKECHHIPYLEQIYRDIMINPHYQTQLKQLGLK